MHVPGHYLDPTTCAITATAAAGALAYGAARIRRDGKAPARLLAATAAGIFAAQMVNFPVEAGTSGHLVGGVLAGMVLGPWLGLWAVAIVLAIQCLLFGDGGLATLGANVLNMGVVGSVFGYAAWRAISRFTPGVFGKVTAAGIAGWLAVVAGAALCSCELAAAGTFHLADSLGGMVKVHALIGISEGLITAAAALLILKTAPQLLSPRSQLNPALHSSHEYGRSVAIVLIVALMVALVLAPVACSWPDGLESVAKNLGEPSAGTARLVSAPFVDYKLAGIDSPILSNALAGALGVLIVFATAAAGQSLLGLMNRRQPVPVAKNISV